MLVELNGAPVFADTGGRDFLYSRPTLVFIHGAQHDHHVWKTLINRFAGAARNVLAVDLPGHGRSGGPPLQSIESMADWLVTWLTKVSSGETTPVILIGHSMGSLVALEAVARLGKCAAQLVMVGTAIPMPVSPALLDAARNDVPKAMALINHWSHSHTAWRGGNRGPHGLWLPALNLRIMERQPVGVLFNDLSACNDYRGGMETASRLTCPITLVAGTADRMTPVKSARKLAAKLPVSNLIEIPDAGHALMAETPEAVAAAIGTALNPSA